jgi:hypothetical protein
MTPQEYLKRAQRLHDEGYESDGCTLVGWFVHRFWPDLKPACWAHDYARRFLIPIADQRENDNLFKDTLKHLGAPRWLRTVMYWFTRAQGHAMDRWGMSFNAFLGFLFFMGIVFTMFYLAW